MTKIKQSRWGVRDFLYFKVIAILNKNEEKFEKVIKKELKEKYEE